jgi:predicted enzyme related to lactoylglutathione lyase
MHIDAHAPGSFCWFELATTDQQDAKDFYTNLFGWEFNDTPIGPSETYTTFLIENRAVAAAYTMRDEQRQQDMPPMWLPYISVASADESAEAAARAGGTVKAPPFDVMDLGRMAVISDPTGATFALWQAKSNPGTGIKHANGTVVWADLNTSDPARAAEFYRTLFGWQILAGKDKGPAGPDDYGHIVNGEEFIGGVLPHGAHPAGVPPHWLIYFGVPDCDGAVAETIGEHGRVLVNVKTMEGTRKYAVLTDPQGAAFAVVQSLR